MNTPDGMTVGELRDILADFDEDTPVMFAYNYGDHWHTEVAESVSDVEEMEVVYSDYHDKFKVVEDGSDDEETASVIILRSGFCW